MNIVIDTSILRKDRRFVNSDILLIKKLSKLDLIKLHFPWVVFKESTTQNLIDVNASIDIAIKEISSLNRKGIHKDDFDKLGKISNDLKTFKSDLENSINRHWDSFIIDSKAIMHEIDELHGKIVMNSYFLGLTPFPTPKSRNDIPDAFIYEAIRSINKKYGKVYFICDDNNLRNSVDKNDDCNVYKSFEEFYNSYEYKKLEEEYKKVEKFADELIVLRENVDKIRQYAKEEFYRDLFAGDEQVIVHENIPSDGNEGALQAINDGSVENILVDKIQFVDGIFYIPVELKAIFRIEYFLFKADIYLYEDDRDISIIDHDWNKHYYLVEESFNARVSFKCTIEQDSLKDGYFEFGYEPATIEGLEIIKK